MTREEAIKEAYGIPVTKAQHEALQFLIPELAEREDEMVRKELIYWINTEIQQCSIKEHADKLKSFVAYLEKQEPKPIKVYDNMDDLIADAMIDEISESDMLDRDKHNRIYWINKHRQKPAEWSEDDKRMLRRCIKSIESSKNFAETQTFKEAKDKEKEWLISLPERFNLQDVREQYPIEDCDYGLEIALDILVKTLNKVQGYQTDDGIREHQTAIQAVKDAMKAWSYPYGKNETVDNLIGIAEFLEMDGNCMFNGMSGDDCGQFLRDLARKEIE